MERKCGDERVRLESKLVNDLSGHKTITWVIFSVVQKSLTKLQENVIPQQPDL